MIILKNEDLFSSKLKSLLADYDRDSLVNLYQPLIGYTAVAVYFSLWSEANNQLITSENSHEDFFLRMQIPSGEFVSARKKLESIGLIKTFLEVNKNINIYHYELYAPKNPGEFFNDTILYGLLIKYLGEKEANRLKNIYVIKNEATSGENITTSFGEIFHPDFEDESFLKTLSFNGEEIKKRNRSKVFSDFSFELFIKEIKKISQLNEKSFVKEELKTISKLATLYGVDEVNASSCVANIYDLHKEKGERIDTKELAKAFLNNVSFGFTSNKRKKYISGKVSSDSSLANKINLFEKVSPKQFLTYLQNGAEPAPSDLWLIYDLGTKYQLTNPVINVVLDYVLTTKNNVLSRPFCEKIATSLIRENIVTAVDAMNYINENVVSSFHKLNNEEAKKIDNIQKEKKMTPKEEEESWDNLLDDFNKVKDGKN